jgi:hypothetical protein
MIINIQHIFIVMTKIKRELNPTLKSGDRIMCLHMDGETSVPMGTTGTVRDVVRDPFEDNGQIINVKWDNDSTLSLVSVTDQWIKEPVDKLQEQLDSGYDFFQKNSEIFDNFDYRFLNIYLKKLRDAGPVNMFESTPFLYSGREWIDRYHGEDQEDNEAFQEVLEMADKAKDKMIQGTLNYMESKNMEIELNSVNKVIKRLAQKILQFYISFS